MPEQLDGAQYGGPGGSAGGQANGGTSGEAAGQLQVHWRVAMRECVDASPLVLVQPAQGEGAAARCAHMLLYLCHP